MRATSSARVTRDAVLAVLVEVDGDGEATARTQRCRSAMGSVASASAQSPSAFWQTYESGMPANVLRGSSSSSRFFGAPWWAASLRVALVALCQDLAEIRVSRMVLDEDGERDGLARAPAVEGVGARAVASVVRDRTTVGAGRGGGEGELEGELTADDDANALLALALLLERVRSRRGRRDPRWLSRRSRARRRGWIMSSGGVAPARKLKFVRVVSSTYLLGRVSRVWRSARSSLVASSAGASEPSSASGMRVEGSMRVRLPMSVRLP